VTGWQVIGICVFGPLAWWVAMLFALQMGIGMGRDVDPAPQINLCPERLEIGPPPGSPDGEWLVLPCRDVEGQCRCELPRAPEGVGAD
jgi:hypothetical protein